MDKLIQNKYIFFALVFLVVFLFVRSFFFPLTASFYTCEDVANGAIEYASNSGVSIENFIGPILYDNTKVRRYVWVDKQLLEYWVVEIENKESKEEIWGGENFLIDMHKIKN